MRFAFFVDGSNLFGTLKHLGVRVDDYEEFYQYVFRKAVESWSSSLYSNLLPPIELRRVYWYAVGTIDDWNLGDPKAQAFLKSLFDSDVEIRRSYMAEAGKKLAGQPQDKVALEAWSMCFSDFKDWYDRKRATLDGMKRFYFGVRRDTDFIDIIDSAHWKVDFLHKVLAEKGLDTAMAVDMVALQENYDVAIIISGDADNIPSIRYIKDHNKSVAVVEFLKGYPPEKRGKNASSHLKLVADFVVQVYEMDLVAKGIAYNGTQPADDPSVISM